MFSPIGMVFMIFLEETLDIPQDLKAFRFLNCRLNSRNLIVDCEGFVILLDIQKN